MKTSGGCGQMLVKGTGFSFGSKTDASIQQCLELLACACFVAVCIECIRQMPLNIGCIRGFGLGFFQKIQSLGRVPGVNQQPAIRIEYGRILGLQFQRLLGKRQRPLVARFMQRPCQIIEHDKIAGVALVQHEVMLGRSGVLLALDQAFGQCGTGAGVLQVAGKPAGEAFLAFFGALDGAENLQLADEQRAGGFKLVRALEGGEGGWKVLARGRGVAFQNKTHRAVWLLLLHLFGEFLRFVKASALNLDTTQLQLSVEEVRLNAQGIL